MDVQIAGGHHDSTQNIKFANSEECKLFFDDVKKVFFNISSWGLLFGKGTNFIHVKKTENLEDLQPLIGDFVKIKIPGPGNRTGHGFDWVQIVNFEAVHDDLVEGYILTVSPTHVPGSNVIAHFFKNKAKNYFSVKKYDLEIVAEVHGRNEIPNYKNLPLRDKIRNFFIANGGIFGFSKVQWELWTKNILDEKYLTKCLKNKNQTNQ